MSPLAGHRVIPEGWAAHHQPAAAGFMGCTVDLHRPQGQSGWDPINGPTQADEGPYAEGVPARVQARPARDAGGESAGQDVTTGSYLVAVPLGTPLVRVRDVVTVTTSPGDPQFTGKALLVEDVTYDTHPFQRDLVCTLDLTRQDDQSGG